MSIYHFIINPHSKTGHSKELWLKLATRLDEQKIEYKTYFTKERGHATQLAKEICEANKEESIIVIVGGDGTANEVINGISSYEHVKLGYIPLGSSNDLARGLKLPKNPYKALDQLLEEKNTRLVDHGQVICNDNGQIHKFAVSTGIGYDAAICYEALTSRLKKGLNKLNLGKLTYILIAVKQIFTTKLCDAEIVIDGKESIQVKRLLFMASHIHIYEGGGLRMAPMAIDNDQKLCVCVVSNISRWRVLLLMPSIFFGKHTMSKAVRMIECESISIKTKKAMVVHTDGEIIGFHDNLTISCTPKPISMLL